MSQDWFADNAPPEAGGDWFEQNAPGSRNAMRSYAPPVPKPAIDMQGSYTAQALNPTGSVASPGEASYVAAADPESQSRMLTAASIGAGGTAAVAAAPAALAKLLPPTIAGVQAVGEWAKRNPIVAYAIYDQLHQHFGGALRFIKGMPAPPGAE